MSGRFSFGVLALVPVAIAAYAVRTVLVLLLRDRAPRVAAAVDDHWTWAPLLVVLVVLTMVHPLLGLGASAVTVLVLTSSHAVGSPFRPRR